MPGYNGCSTETPACNNLGVVRLMVGHWNGLLGAGGGSWAASGMLASQGSGTIEGTPETDDWFGAALAAGDFDKDGYADLAVSAPLEDIGDKTDAGLVHILYGIPGGLSTTRTSSWHQDVDGIKSVAYDYEEFGAALAVGDFNSDGYPDLAIGTPGDQSAGDAVGSVTVLFSNSSGVTSADAQWTQDSDGVPGGEEDDDRFGAALAVGDWGDAGDLSKPFADIPPTSNAPLRGGKASVFEGGIREPCIVVWPGVVREASRSDAMIQSIDFLPTLVEAAGAELPAQQKLDGRSFLPVLRGKAKSHRDTIFTFFPHNTAASSQLPACSVCRGDWKLIRYFHDGPKQEHRYELYNLRDDLGETRDVSADQQALVKDLDALIEGFLSDTGAVVPGPNPAWSPNAKPGDNARKEKAPADPLQGWKIDLPRG